jgi:hypothetical protein
VPISTRRKLLIEGSLLCGTPALLFIPFLAALTVCPPKHGIKAMQIMAIGFVISAAYGISRLLKILASSFDFDSLGAVAGICVGVLVIAGCLWGFIAPLVLP